MCGRLNVTGDPFVQNLLKSLGVDLNVQTPRYSRFIRATDKLSIVREINGYRRLDDATWWLLLDKTDDGFKPSKYTSFNTRYDKLNIPRSAGYKAYRETRCIIPASGFGETEFINKKPVYYHDIIGKDNALALGGLYREWFHPNTGEVTLSCSVITLPPHPKLANIHTKAMPLILPQLDNTINTWLDSSISNTEVFSNLLTAHIPQTLIAQRVDKPSTYNPVSEQFEIKHD